MHRPDLRHLDMSGALAAGKLIVLAETEPGAMPIPIEVEGDLVTGEGVTYYQFLLPLNRTALSAATQPITDNAEGDGKASTPTSSRTP